MVQAAVKILSQITLAQWALSCLLFTLTEIGSFSSTNKADMMGIWRRLNRFSPFSTVPYTVDTHWNIRITRPRVLYPLTPYFNIVKLGLTGVYFISFFLL